MLGFASLLPKWLVEALVSSGARANIEMSRLFFTASSATLRASETFSTPLDGRRHGHDDISRIWPADHNFKSWSQTYFLESVLEKSVCSWPRSDGETSSSVILGSRLYIR